MGWKKGGKWAAAGVEGRNSGRVDGKEGELERPEPGAALCECPLRYYVLRLPRFCWTTAAAHAAPGRTSGH